MPNFDKSSRILAHTDQQDRRLGIAAKLGAVVIPAQLSTPFEISPRVPMVAGRGSLKAYRAWIWDSAAGQSGEITISPSTSPQPTLNLTFENVDGFRLLIDGYFQQASELSMVGAAGDASWAQNLLFDGEVGSFLTPALGPGTQEISVFWQERPVAGAKVPGPYVFERAVISIIDPSKS